MEKRNPAKKRNFFDVEIETLTLQVQSNQLVLFGSLKSGVKGHTHTSVYTYTHTSVSGKVISKIFHRCAQGVCLSSRHRDTHRHRHTHTHTHTHTSVHTRTHTHTQCLGKLLFKVMQNNITLLPENEFYVT